MKYFLTALIALLICISSGYATQEGDRMTNPQVIIKTSEGDIKVSLHQDKVPDTVKNFLSYVDEKHYDNTIFHRVIKNFMIQGGGFTTEFKEKKTKSPIKNEAMRCAPNKKGTIAMARTSDVHSATAQFYINTVDNGFLNYSSPTPQGFGYCVFGEVVEGMDVVKKIEAKPTGNKSGHQDVPVESIKIIEIKRVEK